MARMTRLHPVNPVHPVSKVYPRSTGNIENLEIAESPVVTPTGL